MLPFKVPLMKGSVVEVMATAGRFEFLVLNPPDAQELFWQGAGHHARTVPKPYRGPQRFAMEQHYDPEQEMRLALTCWAQGIFDVLAPAPRAMGPRGGAFAAAGAAASAGASSKGGAAASGSGRARASPRVAAPQANQGQQGQAPPPQHPAQQQQGGEAGGSGAGGSAAAAAAAGQEQAMMVDPSGPAL
jgi:hypothetical protein